MTSPSARILVTDDDPLMLSAATRLLTSAGYEVIPAINGEQTLQLVQEHRPDLMLLDVVLPDIDGTEVCRRIKADARTADIFVILLSGVRTGSDEQSDAMEGGADGYITRPIANRELLARIQAYLRIKTAEQKLKEYTRQIEEVAADKQRINHELEMSQTELEKQNKELLSARAETESALRQYENLYDFAPVGYFTMRRDGVIQKANLAGAKLLGIQDGSLPQGPFDLFVSATFRTTFSDFLEKVFTSRNKETCEVGLERDETASLWVHIEAILDSDETCQAVVSDITERKQAEDTLRQQNQVLSALQDTTLELISQLDLNTLLENIVKRACALLGTSAGMLDLVDPATNQLIPRIGVGALEESLQYTVQPGEGLAGIVWQTGKMLVVPEYDQWSGRLGRFSHGTLGSVIGVPLVSDTQVLGVLVIGSANGIPHFFDSFAIEILNQFARLATVAVQNARLFSNLQAELTERNRAEDVIRQNERRLRDAQAIGRIGDWEIDMTKGQLFYSDEMFELLERDPTLGPPEISNAMSYLEPQEAEKMQQMIMRTMATGEGWEMDVRVVLPSKKEVWHHEIGSVTKDSEGNVLKILGVAQDITARKQVEEQLARLNQQLELILGSAAEGILGLDLAGRHTFVNPAAAIMLGYEDDELIGNHSHNVWHHTKPDGSPYPEAECNIHATLQTGTAQYVNSDVFWRKNGSNFAVEYASTPIFEQGKLAGAVVTFTDITERKRAEEALRESEERYKTMFETASLAINITRGTDIIYANPSYLEMFGLSSLDELKGYSPLNLFAPEARSRILENIQRRAKGLPVPNSYETECLRKDGTRFPVLMHLTRTMFADGPATIGFILDITERKRAEDEMQKRMIELEMLYESGLALPQLLNSQAIGEKIIELLEQKMDWHHTIIRLYHPQDETLEIIAFSLPEAKSEEEQRAARERITNTILKPGEGLSGWAIQNKQIVRKGNLSNDLRYKQTYPGIQSGLYVPIRLNENVIGVISIESEEPNAFTEADERLAATLANQAAIAIENARLTTSLEQRVKERTAEVQDLYDNAPTGYHSLDANGVIVMINQTELDWLGYTREEVIGIKTFHDLCTLQSQKVFEENFPRFKAQGWIKDLEFELIRKNGSTFPVLLNATAIYDAHGKYLHSRSTLFDITERKRAEEAARKLSQAIEYSPATVVITNRDGVIEYVNPTFCEVTGYTLEEAIGQNPRILKSGVHAPEYYQAMWSVLTAGQHWHGEFCNKKKNGELYWEYASISPIKNEYGETTHYVGVKEDVTERKKAEEALRESRDELSIANAALEKAAHLKDEFLASMSHELRTPLTGILGLSEALQLKTYGELNERQLKTIGTIQESGRHLLELINDILDLSKIEAGKLELQFSPCSIADICQASLQLIKGMAHQKRQNINYTPLTEPILVRADARRLKQILVNLLSNAVKFTPEGGELGLEIQAKESERVVKLTVWDKGIGMKPETMPKLFKPFTQLDSSLSREYSGTGLGLSLVKRLTEMHNGGIEVESTFGEGSRFTISLPWSPQNTTPIPYGYNRSAAKATKPLTMPARANSPKILIADDNEIVLQMVADFLESAQFNVIKARSGFELLDLAAEFHPQVILVDIQMPGMDGLETIRRIRSHADPLVAKVPVIAVTAMAMPGDRERCLNAGANEYLSKPVRLKELAAIIQKQIEEKQ
jgi:PAS domain S-box-containing protein